MGSGLQITHLVRGLQGQKWWRSCQQSSTPPRLEGGKKTKNIIINKSGKSLVWNVKNEWISIQQDGLKSKIKSVNNQNNTNLSSSMDGFQYISEREHLWMCMWEIESSTDSLGCKVGTCCPNLSSLSMCSSVVLPALSRPRNTNLPDFLYSPETKPEGF